jgi:hypothetical protein
MKLLKTSASALALLLAAIGFSCQTKPQAAEVPAESVLEVELPAIVQELSPEEQPYTFIVTGSFPVVEGQETLSASIKAQALSLFQDFEAEVRENDRAAQDAGDMTFKDQEYTFDISWKSGRNDRDMSSILLDTQWYAGGAHGTQILQSFVWDVKNNAPLTLQDILPLTDFPAIESLAVHIQEELEKTLNPKEADQNIAEMIRGGASAVAENFAVFLVDRNDVTFYFQRYQVAPGSFGVQSVKVPVKR